MRAHKEARGAHSTATAYNAHAWTTAHTMHNLLTHAHTLLNTCDMLRESAPAQSEDERLGGKLRGFSSTAVLIMFARSLCALWSCLKMTGVLVPQNRSHWRDWTHSTATVTLQDQNAQVVSNVAADKIVST